MRVQELLELGLFVFLEVTLLDRNSLPQLTDPEPQDERIEPDLAPQLVALLGREAQGDHTVVHESSTVVHQTRKT
jgi:hypothetical protein